jgi:hypothetical protein
VNKGQRITDDSNLLCCVMEVVVYCGKMGFSPFLIELVFPKREWSIFPTGFSTSQAHIMFKRRLLGGVE